MSTAQPTTAPHPPLVPFAGEAVPDPGCSDYGACIDHDGCADDENPLQEGDCETCGACRDCIEQCTMMRESTAAAGKDGAQ